MNKLNKKDWKYHRRTIELQNHATQFRKEFKKNVANLLVTALGLVGALSWQKAIDAWFSAEFPGDPTNWIYRVYAAVIMTIIAVIGIIIIAKFNKD